MKIIQGLVHGKWCEEAVGHPADNRFETEAEAQISELARIFDCPETEFRVVEVSEVTRLREVQIRMAQVLASREVRK